MGAPQESTVGETDQGNKAEGQGKGAAIDQEKVERELATFREAAKQGRRQEAIDGLLGLEKQGRVAEDVVTTRKACTALLEVRRHPPAAVPPSSCPPQACRAALRQQGCGICRRSCHLSNALNI